MQKKLFALVMTFLSFFAFSQNSFVIKGKIIEENSKLPMESVTVYLSMAKDSSLIDYTITDKNGNFSLKVAKISNPVFLKVSMVGFEDHKESLKSLTEAKDFGAIALKEQAKMLGELVVKAEAPPIRIKKDTLEFNAASFKVRPDANVETLLKQLPGVEIDEEGKITVNGKEVNQILVNGKPFFDKDGKIALQNLPSEIINKVQISDTKTKKEELSGEKATSNNASINLTIDEDKNKGLFGKFMAGYGTDERYESSTLVNYFKNKRKISVLASSNNINSVGFSMDEIFDNMGGGRSRSMYYNDNGSFGMNGMRFGAGNSGITQSDMVGLNYSDELIKDFESSASYFYTDQHSRNSNRTNQLNFLPTGNFTTESVSEAKSDRFGHNLNVELEYKIDSVTSVLLIPKLTKSMGKDKDSSFQESRDENEALLNESRSESFNDSDGTTFTNSIIFNRSLNKRGRYINASLENRNSKDTFENSINSATIFHQGSDPDDIRDQVKKGRTVRDSYTIELNYTEPIVDSLRIRLGGSYSQASSSEDRKTFDFDPASESYNIENGALTSYLTSDLTTVKPFAGIAIDKNKYNLSVSAGTSVSKFSNHSLYLATTTDLVKTYANPHADFNLQYKFDKSKQLWLNYSYEVDFPDAGQVLPFEDLGNPLNTVKGNPELDLNKTHNFNFNYSNYNYALRSGYSFYSGGNYWDSQIVSSTTYDVNRKRTTTYENVSGTYSTWFGGNWSKSIKKEAHKFRFGFGMNGSYWMNKGFANAELYDAKSVRVTPRVFFNYDYGELLTIAPSYNFTYVDTKYTNYAVSAANNVLHRFNLQLTNYWPKNWVFGNDFGYTYNSNIADGFKKDFYLWNTSLAYSFYDKKFTAKMKVYDILNQNQSATRSISATTIRDEQNTVLQRYMMFSLTYKIEKFAGKERPSRGRFGH